MSGEQETTGWTEEQWKQWHKRHMAADPESVKRVSDLRVLMSVADLERFRDRVEVLAEVGGKLSKEAVGKLLALYETAEQEYTEAANEDEAREGVTREALQEVLAKLGALEKKTAELGERRGRELEAAPQVLTYAQETAFEAPHFFLQAADGSTRETARTHTAAVRAILHEEMVGGPETPDDLFRVVVDLTSRTAQLYSASKGSWRVAENIAAHRRLVGDEVERWVADMRAGSPERGSWYEVVRTIVSDYGGVETSSRGQGSSGTPRRRGKRGGGGSQDAAASLAEVQHTTSEWRQGNGRSPAPKGAASAQK